MLGISANAFCSDRAQLEAGTFRFRDPLNKERRFIPLQSHDAPIKAPWRNSFTSTGGCPDNSEYQDLFHVKRAHPLPLLFGENDVAPTPK